MDEQKNGKTGMKTTQKLFKIGDRVEIAGPSKHKGEIVAIKKNCYSGLTYSVKIGRDRLDGVNPLAIALC